MPSAASPEHPSSAPLLSFQAPEESEMWRTVNDTVMGGRSNGGRAIENGELVFSGTINTNGGGFSSVRREMEPGALDGATAFVLHLKSDGRDYRLIARTDEEFRGRSVSYQAPIPQSPAGEWTSVRVPFSEFAPGVFGRDVPAAPFAPEELNELGFIIADGVDGAFSLSVRSIGLER
ncbi:MAG: CIA30 family protein [Henriciella sp.]|uniref:CIA30 family protein n=1 Tax=Henriciella sp. TaxID=1968823 RepID=UPI003C7125BF